MKIDSTSVLISAKTAAAIATVVDYEAVIGEFRSRFSVAPESELSDIAALILALEELRLLRDYWLFHIPKPAELSGLSDAAIAELAAGIPE